MTNTYYIEFDAATYKRFKTAYQAAVKGKKKSFVFDSRAVLTSYAKYMLEYLKPRFERSSDHV